MNRHQRRAKKAYDRTFGLRQLKLKAEFLHDIRKSSIAERVERRILRATTRRREREEAAVKGLPVQYSIA